MGRARSGSPQLSNLVEVVDSGDVPTDVLLVAAGGVKVGAHSLICASISPVLRAALVGSFRESTSKEINLDHASATTIKKMLSFAIGSMNPDKLSGDDAMDLVLLADRLNYEALHSVCESILLSLLTSNNAADLLACASECNCGDLAQMSKTILDLGSVSDSTRVLVDEKCKLNAQRKKLAKENDEAREALDGVEAKIRDLDTQIDHEVEEVYRRATTNRSHDMICQSPEADHPPYPHSPGRTLTVVALPPVEWNLVSKEERDAERKKYESFQPLLFESLDSALAASLPSDKIMLTKGTHYLCVPMGEESGIKKSVQIIGLEKKGVMLQSPGLGRSASLAVEGADVSIKNIVFHQAEKSAVAVRQGKLWLENCKIESSQSSERADRPSVAGVVIARGSSAYIRHCEIGSTSGSAVLVHPMANAVSISDCTFRGSGCGNEGGGPYELLAPGEAGAVEICDFPYIGEEGDGHDRFGGDMPAEVKLMLLGTNIISCFGPALSYRTRQSMNPRRNFSFPGKSSVVMKGCVFQNICLAREGGSMPGRKAIVFNNHPEFFDRDPELLHSTNILHNYETTRHVQRF